MEKENRERTFEELKIFLDVIDEDSNNILNVITERFEVQSLSDDENICLSRIEEEAEEIRKALAAIKDRIGQIRELVSKYYLT